MTHPETAPPDLTDMGIKRRMAQIFSTKTGAAVIVPFDDILIAGPDAINDGHPDRAIQQTLEGRPDAVVGFGKTFNQHNWDKAAFIANLTLSFERAQHTRKFMYVNPLMAVGIGASAAAIHVNCQSRYREEQFGMLHRLGGEVRGMGIPVISFMYPRGERADGSDENFLELRRDDPMAYAKLICDGIKRGVDIGADAFKTQYTGTPESFAKVIQAAQSRPVVIAGGPRMSMRNALQMAYDARQAGASGTSFGRNVFNSKYPKKMTIALKWIIHQQLSVEDAMAYAGIDERP